MSCTMKAKVNRHKCTHKQKYQNNHSSKQLPCFIILDIIPIPNRLV